MSTGLQASYPQPVTRRAKRKYRSDDEEAVKRSGRTHRSSHTDAHPLKRRKTRKTGSASPKAFLVPSNEPDSDCGARNDSRTPQRDVFRSSPTLCPSDTHSQLHQFSDSKNKCPTSPVHSPPSPSSPKTRMSKRQQVDWTHLSDTGPCAPETPAGRNSGDWTVTGNIEDTGYDGASEWEALSDSFLQDRFSMDGQVGVEDHRSAPSPRTGPVLGSYTPSPMNSDDYKRINDALVNREPSPLSPRNAGNVEHERSEPPHVIVCYPFCDSPPPLSEGFGLPTSPNHEVKEAGSQRPDDVPQDRDVSYGSLAQNIDSRHQGVRRGACAFKSQPSRTYVARSVYTQATYYERERLWPVFDWSCPYPEDQDSPFSGDDCRNGES